jgi:hypothetical protein
MTGKPTEDAQRAGVDDDDDPNSEGCFASPPCFMHELDPAWLGFASRDEVLAWLNELLEGERAGARGVAELAAGTEGEPHAILRDIAQDEASFCAMLAGHIRRLGATPSGRTGSFYDKLSAAQGDARLDLLDRGQAWVVRKLDEIMPRIHDDGLRADLARMRDVHVSNIERCRSVPRDVSVSRD